MVRIQTKSSRIGPLGIRQGSECRLKWGVNEVPEKGRANQALCEGVAAAFGVAKGKVVLRRGNTSRDKDVLVLDVDVESEEIERVLASFVVP